MKRLWIKLPAVLFGAALLLQACSEPQDAPTAPDNEVSVHDEGWLSRASENFHGKVLAKQNYDAEDCRRCHGNQFDGGITGVSCRSCHPSYPHPASGWVKGANSHQTFLRGARYDLRSCQGCHGQDYAAQLQGKSCKTCHVQAEGPESCNLCHGNSSGDARDLINAAPPEGLEGETAATSPAVGAHQKHFAYFKNLSAQEVCQECHLAPNNFFAASHIGENDRRAEAVFNGPLGSLITEGGNRKPNGAYDFGANTCGNTYCHGNWALRKSQSRYDFIYAAEVIAGNSAAPKWTEANSAACGSCHGLPPTGHTPFGISACATCHQGVVDIFGAIADSTKHLNGKVNIFQEEYPMF
jgi:predicted CxxxxCH...CXXCH cytochrome family protein